MVAIATSASRALGMIINKTSTLGDLGHRSFDRLVKSCVFSILDYGSEVVGPCNDKLLDDVQHRASRFFLGVNRFCPIPCLNAEMGWLSVQHRQMYSLSRYYKKLLKMDNDHLPKKVFLNTINKKDGWCGKMRDLLEKLNLLQYWEIRSGVPTEMLDFSIRESAKTELLQNINEKTKLRTYRTLRLGLETGSQVQCLYSRRTRSLTTQLKCGVLPLRIETGRFHGELVADRICKLCNSNATEDEVHFVFECPVYAKERAELITCLDLAPNQLNLRYLYGHPFVLGKYIDNLWRKRQNILLSV